MAKKFSDSSDVSLRPLSAISMFASSISVMGTVSPSDESISDNASAPRSSLSGRRFIGSATAVAGSGISFGENDPMFSFPLSVVRFSRGICPVRSTLSSSRLSSEVWLPSRGIAVALFVKLSDPIRSFRLAYFTISDRTEGRASAG